jgi:AcrR family transcriptional regulator
MTASTATVPGGATGKRERILQAAERVFAMEGYHGTTLRGIADEADVKLSLMSYHFETKLGLYREVFRRRQYLNDRRRDMLHGVDFDGEDAIRRIVDAFADPVLQLHENPTDVWFARLVLREASDPSSQERGIIHEFFDPMAEEFIQAISKANPGRHPDFYRWAYLFAVGALTSSSHDARASDLGGSRGQHDVAEGLSAPKARYLKEFIAAGWATPG